MPEHAAVGALKQVKDENSLLADRLVDVRQLQVFATVARSGWRLLPGDATKRFSLRPQCPFGAIFSARTFKDTSLYTRKSIYFAHKISNKRPKDTFRRCPRAALPLFWKSSIRPLYSHSPNLILFSHSSFIFPEQHGHLTIQCTYLYYIRSPMFTSTYSSQP